MFLGVAKQSERLLGKNACYDSLFDCCAAARYSGILPSPSAQINGLTNFVVAGKIFRSVGSWTEEPGEKACRLIAFENKIAFQMRVQISTASGSERGLR